MKFKSICGKYSISTEELETVTGKSVDDSRLFLVTKADADKFDKAGYGWLKDVQSICPDKWNDECTRIQNEVYEYE